MGVVRFGCGRFGHCGAAPDCNRKVELESTFGETQPDVTAAEGCGGQSQLEIRLIRVVNSAMREYKDVTRARGGHFSSYDNVKSKVRLCCRLPDSF